LDALNWFSMDEEPLSLLLKTIAPMTP